MDYSNVAKLHGIKEALPWFISDKSLEFYSKNDIERIETQDLGLWSLQFSHYSYNENSIYYQKTNSFIKHEFFGKEYDLFEYKDCFIYYVFLCNEKTKKFRYITMSDYKDYCNDGVYVYKDKYYCQYYSALPHLLFFNRNQYMEIPGPMIIKELKKAKSQDFIANYFKIDGNIAISLPNISEFYINDDEAIIVHFLKIYEETMQKLFETENPTTYINFVEEDKDIIDKISPEDVEATRRALLYGHDEFIDFCNNICNPDIYKKELLKNGEVRKNLKNNFWIHHEFNSSLREPQNDYIEGEDFTFLIINAIKAFEYLLYRKVKVYDDFSKNNNDGNITERAMLDNLIYYIQNHKEMFRESLGNILSKENRNLTIKSYIELLYYVKDECRNGYFHKERIDNYENLNKKRDKVLEAIAKTIILLK